MYYQLTLIVFTLLLILECESIAKEYPNDPKPCNHPGIRICIDVNTQYSRAIDPLLEQLQNEISAVETRKEIIHRKVIEETRNTNSYQKVFSLHTRELKFLEQNSNYEKDRIPSEFLKPSVAQKLFPSIPGIEPWPESYPAQRAQRLESQNKSIERKLNESRLLVSSMEKNEANLEAEKNVIEQKKRDLRAEKDGYEHMIRGGCHDEYCKD